MFELTGKTAIVTGASRGIGRAIAQTLAARGAHVVAVARGDNAAATVDGIRSAGGSAELASADVTDAASFAAVVKAVAASRGRIDILVNNAGIARDQLALRMKREDWDVVLATNLTASFTCAQAVLPTMVRQRAGRIISISSIVGQMGNPGQVNYAASKAGVIGFSKALAREIASRNVTVNVVAPGLVETDMTKEIADKAKGDWASAIPMGRAGTPEEIAAAVCFLASDEASYITGQVLAVNGGTYT